MNKIPPPDLVPMGKLLKPFGLTGKLRVTIFNEVNSALKVGIEIWVQKFTGEYFSQTIESLQISGTKSCIKFTGCNKREDADYMRGLNFSLSRSEFVSLREKEHYLVDLIGCSVLNEDKELFGSVIDTLSITEQNLMVVEADGKEVLIPFVDEYVLLFDDKEKTLIVKDVEGFIN